MLWTHHIATVIIGLNSRIGRIATWASLAMVLVQFIVVVLRYVFGIGSLQLQESIIYLHATMFLVASADTLIADAHVRVDIVYAKLTPKLRALVNLIGSAVFLLPICILIAYVSFDYIALAWKVREGSRETSGIQAIYLLKSLILVFAAQGALQALAGIITSIGYLRKTA